MKRKKRKGLAISSIIANREMAKNIHMQVWFLFKHLFWKTLPFEVLLAIFFKGKNSKSYGMNLDFFAISSFAIIGQITSVSLPILVFRFPFLWTLHVFLENSKQAQCIYISSIVFANFLKLVGLLAVSALHTSHWYHLENLLKRERNIFSEVPSW